MAYHATLDLTPGDWVQLTNADATAIRVQSLSGHVIHVQATATSTEPSDDEGALVLHPYDIIAANLSLADLFPGVASAARVWATGTGSVSVSHG